MPLTDSLLILGILSLNVAIAEWLCRHTFCKHFGTALLVIIVTAIIANLGIIPTTNAEAPVYGWLTGDLVQLAIFWILLQVNLRALLKAGAPMIIMFLIGSVATFVGVMVGMFVINGVESFGSDHAGLGAMFTGTYTGGSINFIAMADAYHVDEKSGLYVGAVAVDNIYTAFWMVLCIALPRGLGYLKRRKHPSLEDPERPVVITGIVQDTETIHPFDLGIIIAMGAAVVGAARWVAGWSEAHGVEIPSMLFLTVFALVLAQFKFITRLRGTRTLGMFAVYLFLAVIGAWCDVDAFRQLGDLGVNLFFFVMVLISVHGIITFGIGAAFKVDRDIVAIASQANIGGGTSALALARSLGRGELVLPAILVGSLGTGLGNFMGILAAEVLMRMHSVGG